MEREQQNYYGSLCTEMYEILHPAAPAEELAFYLSYAEAGDKILEPLCGSGRFLIPFLERGFDICGMDLSREMLEKLRQKAPEAKVIQGDILEYAPQERFDYIFIPSGSIGLFTDMEQCRRILEKMRTLLKPGGRFVFAVDTVLDRAPEDDDYREQARVKTKEGFDLVLKGKNHYDAAAQTQFSPSVYALYDGEVLLQEERMDFQTHLYRFGEMEEMLGECGFSNVVTYRSYQKDNAVDDQCEALILECTIQTERKHKWNSGSFARKSLATTPRWRR